MKKNKETAIFTKLMVLYNYINSFAVQLNTNKFLIGISMLMLNVGGKYVQVKFHKSTEEYLKSAISKNFIVFCMVFIGTRDVIMALIVTVLFIIITDHLFNDESKYCLVPEKYKRILTAIDTNNDGKLSEEEIQKAIDILKKANKNAITKSAEITNLITTYHEEFRN